MTGDHTQIVEKRGDANRLGFALQLTTVRFVGTFLDDPTAVPPAVLATMSRQLGIDTTTDLTGYRDGKWRFAHAAQIRTEHGYRDLADRAAGFGLTRWLYAQCWTGTERPSALFDRATTWMLAHKVLLPGATTLERFVAKLRHRVDVRVWRVQPWRALRRKPKSPRSHGCQRYAESPRWSRSSTRSKPPHRMTRSRSSTDCYATSLVPPKKRIGKHGCAAL